MSTVLLMETHVYAVQYLRTSLCVLNQQRTIAGYSLCAVRFLHTRILDVSRIRRICRDRDSWDTFLTALVNLGFQKLVWHLNQYLRLVVGIRMTLLYLYVPLRSP